MKRRQMAECVCVCVSHDAKKKTCQHVLLPHATRRVLGVLSVWEIVARATRPFRNKTACEQGKVAA